MAMSEETQLPDGRWVPAQPVPFYSDPRPWYVRLWHHFLVARGHDEDELMEPWWVPMELPIDRLPRG